MDYDYVGMFIFMAGLTIGGIGGLWLDENMKGGFLLMAVGGLLMFAGIMIPTEYNCS